MNIKRQIFFWLFLPILLIFTEDFAFAQENDASQDQDSVSSFAIEEIVVTARKRDESIQDVPLSVTAIQGELAEASVRRLEDIQSFAPNLYINRTPGIASGAAITIRGVSSSEVDKSFEPAIGVVMDGMFL